MHMHKWLRNILNEIVRPINQISIRVDNMYPARATLFFETLVKDGDVTLKYTVSIQCVDDLWKVRLHQTVNGAMGPKAEETYRSMDQALLAFNQGLLRKFPDGKQSMFTVTLVIKFDSRKEEYAYTLADIGPPGIQQLASQCLNPKMNPKSLVLPFV